MSQLAPLLEKLKESSADKVIYAPNELAYAVDGETRRPIAGGQVKGAVILEAVSELLSQDDINGLSSNRPRIVRHEHDGVEYVLEILRQGNGIALGVRLATRAAPNRAPAAAPAAAAAPAPSRTPSGSIKRPSRKMKAQDPPKMETAATAPQPRPGPAPQVDEIEINLGSRVPVQPKIQVFDETQPSIRTSRVEDEPTQSSASAAINTSELIHAAREVAREAAREAARDVAAEAARDVAREVVRDAMQGFSAAQQQHGAASGGVVARAQAQEFPRKGPAKIDTLLREMLQKRASDLHLTADAHPVLRIDGEIHFGTDRQPLSSSDILTMVQEIMTARARHDFETLHDADFAYEIPGLARFRVNVFEDRHGTGAVLRQIPIEVLSAEQLGLPKACIDFCFLSKGLVLVTGPTGSGKSTTLAAMIDYINKNRSDHIITIEDPVEFVHKNQRCLVNQREVGQHTSSFKNALRAALREDPDIVLVGEMRDLETISIAIETAETGHLVFGTLHTTTAISTVDRIIDQFPTDRQEQIRVMLSESLKGVVAQVLCPKIGGGRVAAHEILIGTSAVSAMIREGKTFQLTSTMQTSKGLGMVTMNDSLMNLVMKKLVDPKQAYIKAVDKNGFLTMLRSAGIQPPV